jgi:hypothetical protein
MLKMVVYYNARSQFRGQIHRFTGTSVDHDRRRYMITSKWYQCIPADNVDRIEIYPADHEDPRFDSDKQAAQFIDYPYDARTVYYN